MYQGHFLVACQGSFSEQSVTEPQVRSLALLLSWAVIIGYLWIRFGRPVYGVAGVVALIHDVCIALPAFGKRAFKIRDWQLAAHRFGMPDDVQRFHRSDSPFSTVGCSRVSWI